MLKRKNKPTFYYTGQSEEAFKKEIGADESLKYADPAKLSLGTIIVDYDQTPSWMINRTDSGLAYYGLSVLEIPFSEEFLAARSIAEEALHIDIATLTENCKYLKKIDAYYFWNPMRGGMAVIANSDGKKLVANSSIAFRKHYKGFINGY